MFLEIKNNNVEALQEFLSQNSVDVEDNYLRTPLMNTAVCSNSFLMKWLIENGAKVNRQDKNGWTALFFAAQEANPQTVKLLLENGADPNIQDSHGNVVAFTILRKWKGGKNFDSLVEIIKHGADLKIKNNINIAPLEIISETTKMKLNL